LAEEVRWSHSITVDDNSSPISVNGSTPAQNLTLEYVDSNGESIENDTIRVKNNSVEYPIRSVPANTSSIRVRYEGLLSWRLASSKSLSDVPRDGNTDSTDTPNSSPTSNGTTANETTTNSTDLSPANETTTNSTDSSPANETTTNSTDPSPANETTTNSTDPSPANETSG